MAKCLQIFVSVSVLFISHPSHSIELVSKELFVPSATKGVSVHAFAYYSEADGLKMIRHHGEQTVSDKANVAYREVSLDNGKTWRFLERVITHRNLDEGTWRYGRHAGFVDPKKNILINMILEGIFPSDNPLEGMTQWALHYQLSRIDQEGEPILIYQSPVLESGTKSTPTHPLRGVTIGHNSAMIGDLACHLTQIDTGEILQPVQISPTGPDGHYFNPGGGYTFHNSAVLIGKWNDQETLDWTLSDQVVADPKKTTRGLLEPSVAQFADGRILMVMRGSNDNEPNLPSYRWYSVSEDSARTWSEAKPWTYTDGEAFFSPSSCSMLLKHSNGKIYWIGNINPENSHGNLPRYPLLIGEVDPTSLLLKRETLCIIDDHHPEDSERLLLSNFFAHEDRETHEVVVYLTPLFRHQKEKGPDGKKAPLDWTSDAYRYRIRVD